MPGLERGGVEVLDVQMLPSSEYVDAENSSCATAAPAPTAVTAAAIGMMRARHTSTPANRPRNSTDQAIRVPPVATWLWWSA